MCVRQRQPPPPDYYYCCKTHDKLYLETGSALFFLNRIQTTQRIRTRHNISCIVVISSMCTRIIIIIWRISPYRSTPLFRTASPLAICETLTRYATHGELSPRGREKAIGSSPIVQCTYSRRRVGDDISLYVIQVCTHTHLYNSVVYMPIFEEKIKDCDRGYFSNQCQSSYIPTCIVTVSAYIYVWSLASSGHEII